MEGLGEALPHGGLHAVAVGAAPHARHHGAHDPPEVAHRRGLRLGDRLIDHPAQLLVAELEQLEPRQAGNAGQAIAHPAAREHELLEADGDVYTYDAAGQMESYNGYDLQFDAEGRLMRASNVAKGISFVNHFDDAGERRITLVHRTGKPTKVHRFVTADYHIRDGEEVWFAGGGSSGAEIVRSKGIEVDAYLLDQLTEYVNGTQTEPKPLPEEYMDLNDDGNRLDADDLALAQDGFTTGQRVGGEKVIFRHVTTDHLGGTTHLTDSAGDLFSHKRYHAYGKVASRLGPAAYRGYIGKEVEPELDLGLQRIGARYYAPALGRWVTPDPLIGQSPEVLRENPLESNLYGYSRNSPVVRLDLSGQESGLATNHPMERAPVRVFGDKGLSPRDFAVRLAVAYRAEIAKVLEVDPKEVDPRLVTMTLAQTAAETDGGKNLYNWNFGNEKTPNATTEVPLSVTV